MDCQRDRCREKRIPLNQPCFEEESRRVEGAEVLELETGLQSHSLLEEACEPTASRSEKEDDIPRLQGQVPQIP